MDWLYKMYLNGVYWKGYGYKPIQQAIDIEIRSFKNSEHYKGGKVEVVVKY